MMTNAKIEPRTEDGLPATASVLVTNLNLKQTGTVNIEMPKNGRFMLESVKLIGKQVAGLSNGATVSMEEYDPADYVEAVCAGLTTALAGDNNDLDFSAKESGVDGNDITIAYTAPATPDEALSISVVGTAIEVSLATTPMTVAAMTTTLTGDNNDISYEAVEAGAAGNAISITYTDPGQINQSLSAAVVDTAITISLATDGTGAITTTAADIIALRAATPAMAALVVASNATGDDGTGVVTAMTTRSLSGGSDGAAIRSTAANVKAAIEADADANALVSIDHAAGNNGTGVVTAMAAANLTGGADGYYGADAQTLVESVNLADTDSANTIQALTIATGVKALAPATIVQFNVTAGATATTAIHDLLIRGVII